jgi:hypothetical protein
MNQRWLLLRYDVESTDTVAMDGYLSCLLSAHRSAALPVTLFCTGGALDAREADFRAFYESAAGDPLFEIGDHSYTHIGVGYEAGQSVEALRADYERSLAAHERVLGKRPDSISICGTGGKDGPKLSGFDATPKAQEELAMLVDLGIRRINSFLSDVKENQEFTDYASLGFPEVSGYPSAFSDTSWLKGKDPHSDFLAPLRDEIDRRAEANLPLPVILHDWCAWNHAADKQLTHVLQLTDYARQRGFEAMTIGAAVERWRKERTTNNA